MRDPKFGWHSLWITPVALVAVGVNSSINAYRNFQHRRKIKKILKDNPDVNELSKLSGI